MVNPVILILKVQGSLTLATDWKMNLKTEIYSNGSNQSGILLWFTKYPENSINGTTRIGSRATATYLFLMRADIIKEKAPAAL